MKSIKPKALPKGIRLFLFGLLFLFSSTVTKAQSSEVQQLLLNVEKLSQFKNILNDMKKGYTTLTTGYNAVKDIAKGNFSLHETFIDGLMLVSPEVKKYKRVADIITCQTSITAEYKTAYNRFRASDSFSPTEINYLAKVYKQLFDQSLNNLDELLMVVTSSKLRMSDDERLQAIDRIYADTADKLQFLRNFNRQAGMMGLQRKKEKADVNGIENFYNIK